MANLLPHKPHTTSLHQKVSVQSTLLVCKSFILSLSNKHWIISMKIVDGLQEAVELHCTVSSSYPRIFKLEDCSIKFTEKIQHGYFSSENMIIYQFTQYDKILVGLSGAHQLKLYDWVSVGQKKSNFLCKKKLINKLILVKYTFRTPLIKLASKSIENN